MNNPSLNHEPLIRLSFFLGILILMAVWEGLAPRRPLQTSKSMRWLSNLGIVFIDTITLQLLDSFSAINALSMRKKRGGDS